MRRLYSLCLLVFISSQAFSQQPNQEPNCAQKLRLARATYEQGRLHEIEGQLAECLKGGFSKEEKQLKVEGYKILCLSYIYLEEPAKADEAKLNLKRTDPYYRPNPRVDPAEFVALYKTFREDPIYRIGAKIGVNATQPNVTERVAAVDLDNSSGYKYLIGFQFGAAADLPLNFLVKGLTLHGDVMFQQKKYEINLLVNRGSGFENEFNGEESQSWISLPLTLEYKLFDKKFNPYIAAGVGIDYLLSSTITSERQRDNQASIEPKSFSPEREKLNISAIGAAGVKLPMAGGFIVIEARFTYGIKNVTTKESAFANAQYTLDYGYADSIFKLNSLAITGSYIINIFNPKKLKRK
jgi:outer membrane protein W